MSDRKDIVAAIAVPLCVNDDTLAREGMLVGWDSERAARYGEAVVREIRANAGQFDDCLVRAVRLGGGVASNIGRGVADIMRAVRESLPVADDAPVTMAASVANISGATFPFFRRAGVSRFDFEMLSMDSANFTLLNRVDNLADFPLVVDHFLHAYGNRTLGIVLAYGHKGRPGVDEAAVQRRSALAAAGDNVAHVRLVPVGGDAKADPGECERQRLAMAEALESRGFVQYAPGSFARPGEEDRFTVMERGGCGVVGFGLGAVTRLDGAESRNTSDLDTYLAHADNFALITEDVRSWGLGDAARRRG